ncbi:MAG: M48 family metallopeptidase [Saprospiraceae bacterium]|nr:M48 family metallopeptidase [Saprospiraceae bacterium]MCB9343106.1 M48 family metallopeptidase [Lewinellaceae bacterium]
MWKKSLLILALMPVVFACSKNVFTGRKGLNLIPVQTLNQMSFTEYRSFLQENKPVSNGKDVDLVRRVGNDIKAATQVYYKAKGKQSELKNFAWEFNVVDDPNTVNAFCMPGGKVVVYTGILKITQNEDALAVVMGHEIAHALAGHGNERMSQGLVAQLGLTSLDIALSQKPAATRNLLLSAAGAGAQLGVLLPFSRKHESEADEIGLYLMAMAGYNPAEAAPFWDRMNKSAGGSRPPEFLSTHPDPTKRSQNLRSLVNKARAYAVRYPVPASSKYKK